MEPVVITQVIGSGVKPLVITVTGTGATVTVPGSDMIVDVEEAAVTVTSGGETVFTKRIYPEPNQ